MRRVAALIPAIVLALSSCTGVPRGGSGGTVPLAAPQGARSSCPVERAKPPAEPAFADTIWPSERHDQWRTAAAAGGLPAALDTLRVATAAVPPVPTWGYVGLDGDVYVLGGAPFGLDIYTKLILGAPSSELPKLLAESLAYSKTLTPYVVRIDPAGMAVTKLSLTQSSGVNYPGGMLVDANGYLYAVARGVLYKIDPKSFSIVAAKTLPLAPGSSGGSDALTAYNGIMATEDGDLLLKGFVTFGGSGGLLLRVDPDDLSILAQAESSEISGARMAVAAAGGREYVYLVGSTEQIRFLVGKRSFTLDSAYSRQYLESSSGDSEGTSDIFMGGGVVFTNNTSPQATTAMRIYALGASDSAVLQSQPAFASTGAAWNFFMPTGDPYESGLLVAQDQTSGHLAGFLACSGGTTVVKLWENDTIEDSAGTAIDDRNDRLYADDHRCTSKGKCTLSLVVLNLRTGKEIARTRVAGNEPSMAQIFIGPHDAVYYLASDTGEPRGYVSRVTAH